MLKKAIQFARSATRSTANFVKRSAARIITTGAIVGSAASARATDTAPLDLSSVGTTVAGYVATAALAGVTIMTALWGLRIIVKAFKTVGK